LRFLQDKHQFRELILKVAGQQSFKERISTAGFLRGRAVATELKQVIRIFKDIDFDKDNKLDFEEFVELFRRTGHLIELKSEANPRHKILCLLGGISQDTKGVSNSMAGQLVDLTRLVDLTMEAPDKENHSEDGAGARAPGAACIVDPVAAAGRNLEDLPPTDIVDVYNDGLVTRRAPGRLPPL